MADPFDDLGWRNLLGDDLSGMDTQNAPPGVRRHPWFAPDRTAPEHPGARMLLDSAAAIPPLPKSGGFSDYLPAWSDLLPPALRSVASWGSGQPQTQDMLTPTGLAAMRAPLGMMRGARPPISAAAAAPRERARFRPPASHDMEVPMGAATKYDDEIFRTPVHGLEEEAARAKLGPERFNKAKVTMGFWTNKGNFVSRAEAARLAQAADENYPYSRMDSNDMRSKDYDGTLDAAPSASLPGTFANALADDPLDPYRR